MMKVMFFVGSLKSGGLERFVSRVSLESIKTGDFQPIICCLKDRTGIFLEPLEDAGIEVFEAPENWERNPVALYKLSRLVKSIQPDLIHSQFNFSLLQQYVASFLAGNVTFCVTERSLYRLIGYARIRRWLQFHVLRIAGAHYSANCKAVALHLANKVKVNSDTIPILPNGVPRILLDENIRVQMRKGLQWENNQVGIGYIARMMKEKGHNDFLHVVSQLHNEGFPIRVCLLGDGPSRSEIENLIDKLGIRGILIVAGIVSNVEEYLQAFDIVALFSRREGMPNAIMEAMAANKAIIATNVGAVGELLHNGGAGITINEPNIYNLVAGLQNLIRDKDLRFQLGQEAGIRIDQCYSIKLVLNRLAKYYQQKLN